VTEIKFRTYFENKFWYFTLNEIMERVATYHGDWDIQALRAEKQQFSGLKDQSNNKNEVYEGDIIEEIGWEGDYYLVEFIDCAFYAKSLKKHVPAGLRTRHVKLDELMDIQVVGNKFDNPDLLKKGEN